MKQFLFGGVTAFIIAAGLHAAAKEKPSARPNLEMTVESSLPFDQTVEAIKMAAKAENYGFQGLHPLSDVLASKGFPREKLHILEVCKPKEASDALKNDVRAGLTMPCPIMVWMKGERVFVTTYDTRIMSQMYNGKDMPKIGASVYFALKNILSSVAK
jgi:uncharacterized protein (DUF302 family)